MSHAHYFFLLCLGLMGLSVHILMKISLAMKKNPSKFEFNFFIKDNMIDWIVSLIVLVVIIIFIHEIVEYICTSPCKEEYALHKLIAFTGGLFNTELLRKFKQLLFKKIER